MPAPFGLDWIARDRAVWHMPRNGVPTVYLTCDDGPNPSTTPDLLDVLAGEGVHARFFVIDEHITDHTAPIVRRIMTDWHAVALHTSSRRFMLMRPSTFARALERMAAHIDALGGRDRAAHSDRMRAGAAGRCSRGWRRSITG